MRNKYAHAKDVLPPGLLKAVQKHFTGLLWIPGGEAFYQERSELIATLKLQGLLTHEIARLAGLSPRRVRQILTEDDE